MRRTERAAAAPPTGRKPPAREVAGARRRGHREHPAAAGARERRLDQPRAEPGPAQAGAHDQRSELDRVGAGRPKLRAADRLPGRLGDDEVPASRSPNGFTRSLRMRLRTAASSAATAGRTSGEDVHLSVGERMAAPSVRSGPF